MKDNVKIMRRQATDWEKIFAKDICYKGLIPKTLKKQLSSKKTACLENGPKILTDTSPKVANDIWCGPSFHMLSGKCELKQQWDSTAHLLEWSESRTLTTPNAEEDIEQQKLASITASMVISVKMYGF